MSSYDEKFKALNVCSGLPVAVNSLDTLNRIGRFVQIGEYDAYRLTSFSNNPISSTLAKFFSINDHIWISPEIVHEPPWNKSGFFKNPGSDLDHLHSKAVAKNERYKYVLLYSCERGANRSAGNEEFVRSQNADLKRSEKQPILIADELHWRKLWGVTQKKLKSVE